ncbi:MAG TPA: SRPBCC family protein [Chitinophagales bacterium]|nr:SRPBCC family protein [Chitinophagales bacterium]
MKILKTVGIAVLSLVVLLLVVSFFLPSHIHVERSRVIKARPDAVFAQVNDLKNWTAWMPWNKKDPNMQIEWGAQTAGVGAGYSWKSVHDEVGNGKMHISKSEPNALVETQMYLMDSAEPMTGTLKLEPADGGNTKVTWSMDGDSGKNPMWKYMALMMDKMVGPDFEKGLEDLDRVAQANPVPEPQTQIVEAPDTTQAMQPTQL